jgi:imidazolonepropionase-like amidohydrolase
MYIDAHIHISLNGEDFRAARQAHHPVNHEIIRTLLRKYKESGIYFLRDGGDNLDVSFLAREIAREEGMIFRTPVYAIYKRGAYGNFLGKAIGNPAEFRTEFPKLMAFKPDHLKIILTGLVDFDDFGKVDGVNFRFEELYYMVQSAKDKNLPVMVHASSAEAVRLAVEAGADTVEHGYFLTEEVLHLLKANGTIWVPTLAPLGNLVVYNEARYQLQIENIKKIYQSQKETVKKAYDLGVKLAVGSDAGSYHVYHGRGFWDEVDHFTRAGLSKEQVLAMAWVNGTAALHLRRQELDAVGNIG